MMSETEAYFRLILMASTLLCLPYVFLYVTPILAKLFVARFFPPKHLDVEIINGDTINKKRISLENDDELINALLNIRDNVNE
tara:strand:+ start:3608 stop:3856 length:249 start_codon:yes stop_codon:yes gene_type:complete